MEMYFVKNVLQMSGLTSLGKLCQVRKVDMFVIQKLFQNHECNEGWHLKSVWATNFLTCSGSVSLEKVINDCSCLLC